MLSSIKACTQEKAGNTAYIPSNTKSSTIVPFLTRQNDFIYVDKTSLEPITDQKFRYASTFTSTGFAMVENEKRETAVIDADGKLVLDFSSSEIELQVAGGLTFYKREQEFKKKMPIWKWEWNILGGGIKKEKDYHDIEIGVVETGQIILKKEVPYLEDSYYLNFTAVGENHVFWNGNLYAIKKDRLKKQVKNIAELLEGERFIKTSNGNYSINKLNEKKALYTDLKGTETLAIKFQGEIIELHEINKDRYTPSVPKLLLDNSTNDVYPFPQYDKVFPKEITKASASQIEFIKKASLIYSITNSPYFLLGVFNYDEDIWAFDWLYMDTKGIIVDTIEEVGNFKVRDQVGNLIWPDRQMIFPDKFNDQHWKFGKISSFQNLDNLYILPLEDQNSLRTKGLWNKGEYRWEIKPEYYDILVLDGEAQIYALQKEVDGLYVLYDNKNKHPISSKLYHSINSAGLVHVKIDSTQTSYYYIDIKTGQEYKEH